MFQKLWERINWIFFKAQPESVHQMSINSLQNRGIHLRNFNLLGAIDKFVWKTFTPSTSLRILSVTAINV